MEYELGVSAQDVSAKTLQKSATHSLKILVGERDPQFFETQYVASVPESATERYKYVLPVIIIIIIIIIIIFICSRKCQSRCNDIMQSFCTTAFHQDRTSRHQWISF